jgi:hypothetical protein
MIVNRGLSSGTRRELALPWLDALVYKSLRVVRRPINPYRMMYETFQLTVLLSDVIHSICHFDKPQVFPYVDIKLCVYSLTQLPEMNSIPRGVLLLRV